MSKKNPPVFYHIIMSALLAFKGYDKWEHHYPVLAIILFLFAAVILALVFLLKKSHFKSHLLMTVIHLLEGIAVCFTAWVYFEEGKKLLPYVSAAAGVVLIAVGIIHARKLSAAKDN